MSDIINFKLIRFENLLIKFAKSNEIPNEFLDGSINIDDYYKEFKDLLSPYHTKIYEKLKRLLTSKIKKSKDNLVMLFLEEYFYFYNHQCTKEDKWKFDTVMSKYRKNLNPIRALYYELIHVMNSYNPENHSHTFIVDLFLDPEWRNSIINCITKDINTIDIIMTKYHYPLEKAGVKPFEFLHLVELKKDFIDARNTFRSMSAWSPDE